MIILVRNVIILIELSKHPVNKEEHLSPILGTKTLLESGVKAQINRPTEDEDPWASGQEPELMRLIASELDIDTKHIANFELGLFDCQPAILGGIKNEFLNSARLDNLATCFVALESILAYSKSSDKDQDDMVSMIALFDHEEIGSRKYSLIIFHGIIFMVATIAQFPYTLP